MNLDCNRSIQVTNRKSGSTNPWIQPPRSGAGNGQNGDCDDANSLLDARNQEPSRDLLELIWVVPLRIMCVGDSDPKEWTDLFPAETLFQPQMEQPVRRHVLLDCCGAGRSQVKCYYKPDGPLRSKTPEVNLLVLIPTLDILGAVWIAGHLSSGIHAVHIVNECHERPIIGIKVFKEPHRE